MSSPLRNGLLPRPLAIALDALQRIAERATHGCQACREIRAEFASGAWLDESKERQHRRRCPGAHAWLAIARIAKPSSPTLALDAIAIGALERIALEAALTCQACHEARASDGRLDGRSEHEADCPGALVGLALAQIARPSSVGPATPS